MPDQPTSSGPATAGSSDPIHHEVDLGRRRQHLVAVTTTVPADLAAGARVVVATWTPGSYVERDYVHHLQSLTATDGVGEPVPLARDGHTAWRLPADVVGPVTLELEWYANELTVRTNHVDDQHALLVPPATFPLVDGAADRPVTVGVTATDDGEVWGLLPTVATSDEQARPRRSVFAADDQLHLVDSAFEVGEFRTVSVEVAGVPHTWVHANEGGHVDLDRIAADVTAIASSTLALVGGELPIDSYTFLCIGADHAGGGGGLEHRDGAVLMMPVLTDSSDDGIARIRSLVAHEYFHLWNVKRLVPAELVDLRLDRPTHTTSLWVAEGWTAYYDGLLPTRAGLASSRDMLDGLRDDLTWVQRTPGARRQSLVDSSWHAWTGLYVRDENSVNAGTSYYTHGAVVAAVLDLAIRGEEPEGDGLDDAFRLLWQRFGHDRPRGYPSVGYRHEDVVAAISDAAGRDLSALVHDHVEGTEPPPLADLLDVVGCSLVESAPSVPRVDLGIRVDEDDRGPVVAAALRDGPAWTGGITGGDRLLAVGGTVLRRGDLQHVLARLEPGEPVELTVERDHRLVSYAVTPDPPLPTLRIVPVDEPTERQRAVFTRWSGRDISTVADDDGDREEG